MQNKYKAFLAVKDQIIFSLANFSMNIFLIRLMSSEEYGLFTIIYGLFLLTAILHNSIIIEPVLINGASKSNKYKYIEDMLMLHWIFAFFSGLFVVLVSFFYEKSISSLDIILFIIASLTILFTRKITFLLGTVKYSVIQSLLYFCFLTIIINMFSQINIDNALFIIFIAATVAVIYFFYSTKVSFIIHFKNFKKTMLESFAFAKWLIFINIFAWILTNYYYFVLPLFWSNSENTEFKMAFILIMPILQYSTAITTFYLTKLANSEINTQLFNKHVHKLLKIILIPSILYLVFLIFASSDILALVYNKDFKNHDILYATVGLAISMNILTVYVTALKSKKKTRVLFNLYFLFALFTIFIGGLVAKYYAALGSMYSIMAIYTLLTFIIIYIYYSKVSFESK